MMLFKKYRKKLTAILILPYILMKMENHIEAFVFMTFKVIATVVEKEANLEMLATSAIV